jgi:hypothetical protein
MDNCAFKTYTLYIYKDDLLGCNILRHKYASNESLIVRLRDIGEKIDITLNNMEFLVHEDDRDQVLSLLNSK